MSQLAEHINALIRDYANVIRGHDAVHPDRNECGGVGGCALMRAEHDTGEDLIDILDGTARSGMEVTVTVTEARRRHAEPTLTIPGTPKALRETLCVAQTALGFYAAGHRYREHVERLQRLINQLDEHRPLGPNGKHGDRHTATCGCEGGAA